MNTIILLQEAAIVGFFISMFSNTIDIFKKSKYTPFLAGALTHIFWEICGLNQSYCENKMKNQ